jgi:hypothetical protein
MYMEMLTSNSSIHSIDLHNSLVPVRIVQALNHFLYKNSQIQIITLLSREMLHTIRINGSLKYA